VTTVLRGAAMSATALLCAGLTGLAGCAADDSRRGTTITVYAASSLKGAFEEIGETFEQEHPGTTVEFNFAGSADLVAQVQQGAPADVVATADEANMAKLAAEDLLARPAEAFASNTLTIAVPSDNPAGIDSLSDLTRPGVHLVVCAPAVPCGAAASQVEEAAGLDWQPVSEEPSVADVLGKVASGEADAGLVYVTDVKATTAAVRSIDVPLAGQVVNTYPIAPIDPDASSSPASSEQVRLAAAFVDLVLAAEGQQVLAGFGFGTA
jgi:molybdate transport system substrate-binding protein